MIKPNFADYVHLFFCRYLPLQRGVSKNTITSYSYAVMLFYIFCKNINNVKEHKLTFSSINKALVEDFCIWLETERNNSISTRNQRLSALHALFSYIQTEDIEQIALCRDILEIPLKNSKIKPLAYLTEEEVTILFRLPNKNVKKGRRDIALMLLLYDTGARAQEFVNLCVKDIRFGKEVTVQLFGKGNKTRIVPITPETGEIVKGYMKENDIEQLDQLLFTNRSKNKLTNMGITYILKKYVVLAKKAYPSMFTEPISPHMIRRSKGSHLIQNNVNIYYVRDFLGHSSVITTERYARNNPEVIRKAIEKSSNKIILDKDYYNEKEKQVMMDFLKSLQ